ncbi:MAG: hypothetical protein IT445_13660 [Phycisphaeraceae bacterium]|nr:hypothetical protein [Phycisphaeraceae bacterium]
MDSYERVMAALDHRVPDRPPLNYYGTPETDRKLLAHLGLDSREALLRHLGADMRYVGAKYVGPSQFCGAMGYNTASGTDMWGVGWKPVSNDYCTYYEIVHHPLAEAQSMRDIEAHAWPRQDWLSVDHFKQQIDAFNEDQRYAIVFSAGPFLETAWAMRGFERFLMDLIDVPEIADLLLKKVVDYHLELFHRAVDAAEGGIDIVWTASDIGMQTGMMFSPQVWRDRIKAQHRRLVEPFKRMGLRTRYHTDGNVVPVIEDLIEIGIDLLDPIQPGTADMEPENLRDRFGGRISFYGGVDTQHLMPFGTVEQIERQVVRLIEVLGEQGGYIAAASNAVQPDVPVENILALYRTAREYRYPLTV